MPRSPLEPLPPAWERRPPRCLVADRSAEVVSQLHAGLVRLVPGVFLVPPARDGREALLRVHEYHPDYLFLDLEMPRMGGLTTLRALSGVRPPRTVVLAEETSEGGRATWEALGLGAIDFLPKRARWGHPEIGLGRKELEERLRALLGSAVRQSGVRSVRLRARPLSAGEIEPLAVLVALIESRRLHRFARWLSRGALDLQLPLLLDVPHPQRFTRAIAEGLDRTARCPVRVAVSGQRLAPGHLFLLPSGHEAFLTGRRGEVDLELLPLRRRETGIALHKRSIQALLELGATPGGIILAGPPSRRILGAARQAAAQGRLFLLPPRSGEAGLEALRGVDRIGLLKPRSVA